MKKRDHWDMTAWLRHQKFIGTLKTREQQETAEDFPGITCYRDLFGGHYWIQVYHEDGTLWLLHGKDSTLPGLDVQHHSTADISICDCGKWMPASKDEMAKSREIDSIVRKSVAGRRN